MTSNSKSGPERFNSFWTGDFWQSADDLQAYAMADADLLFRTSRDCDLHTLQSQLIEYRYFTRYYISDVALVVSKIDEGPLRSFLAEILADELGWGDPQKAHPAMYDSFLRSIGVDVQALGGLALRENVSLLDTGRRQLMSPEFPYAYAVGFRGMGGECVCQVYLDKIHSYFSKNPCLKACSDIDWTFWDVHVGAHDIEHRIRTRAMIDEEVVRLGGEIVTDLWHGYAESMNSWQSMWRNIFAAASVPRDHSPRERVRCIVDFNESAAYRSQEEDQGAALS